MRSLNFDINATFSLNEWAKNETTSMFDCIVNGMGSHEINLVL